MDPLHYPIQPWRGWRNHDRHGSGHFGASRDGGSRLHLGADAIALPGDDTVYSPIEGEIERIITVYAGAEFRGVVIRGVKGHSGCNVRILYVEPTVSSDANVHAGDAIGVAQDIAARYPDIVPHVHVEIWKAIDPAEAMRRA